MRSDGGTALSARGLTKVYTLRHQTYQPTTAGEAVIDRIRHPLRRESRERFHALRDVSFELPRGRALGIIGRNGAGKSTLLKILSRVTSPTAGRADVYGRLGSLLEIGTGFHPELTGRENIYLNGAILGMTRGEIARHFDAIVEFAGLEAFLDTPVKRYSGGMYLRLAFSVAAHLEADVLLVDEVLAVGDLEFQRRSLGSMRDLTESGRTIVFVSHSMEAVTALCDTALYLREGQIVDYGISSDVIQRYKDDVLSGEFAEGEHASRREGSGEVRVAEAEPLQREFAPAEPKQVRLRLDPVRPFAGSFFVSCHVNGPDGHKLLHLGSRLTGEWFDSSAREVLLTLTTPWLAPGTYTLDIFLGHTFGLLDAYHGACRLEVSPALPYRGAAPEVSPLPLLPDFSFAEIQPRST